MRFFKPALLATFATLILIAMPMGFGYLRVYGITVSTTAEAFVTRSDMPLFEIQGRKMNVRLAPTPAKWPEETATMYRAASLSIPVHVEVQSKDGSKAFTIVGLSKEGDFLIPCLSRTECRQILKAAQFEIPEQLVNVDQRSDS